MNINKSIISVAKAEIVSNYPKPIDETTVVGEGSVELAKSIFEWGSIFIFLIGTVLLVGALFFYLLATGEESKMKKAHSVLVGAVFFLIASAVVYLVGKLFF